MNIKQLEYFVDLSQTLNFTKTAQNFYISQTAITKCCRKAPSFSCGDIRQLFLDFINKSYRQITFDSIIYP